MFVRKITCRLSRVCGIKRKKQSGKVWSWHFEVQSLSSVWKDAKKCKKKKKTVLCAKALLSVNTQRPPNNLIWILSCTSTCRYFKQSKQSAFLNTYLFSMTSTHVPGTEIFKPKTTSVSNLGHIVLKING